MKEITIVSDVQAYSKKDGFHMKKAYDPKQTYIVQWRWKATHRMIYHSYELLQTYETYIKYISNYHIQHWINTIIDARNEWLLLTCEPMEYLTFMKKLIKINENISLYMDILYGLVIANNDPQIFHLYNYIKYESKLKID